MATPGRRAAASGAIRETTQPLQTVQSFVWSFVAMEYYALVLNRCFVISIDGERLRGVQCRGITGRTGGHDLVSRLLDRRFAVQGDPFDPSSYIDPRLRTRPRRADFLLPLRQIRAVEHDPRPKWGLGEIPHDGRILLRTGRGTREFIVLGRQSGHAICAHLRAAAGLSRPLAEAGASG